MQRHAIPVVGMSTRSGMGSFCRSGLATRQARFDHRHVDRLALRLFVAILNDDTHRLFHRPAVLLNLHLEIALLASAGSPAGLPWTI